MWRMVIGGYRDLRYGTHELEGERYRISTKWEEGEDGSEGKEGAENVGGKMEEGTRPVRNTMEKQAYHVETVDLPQRRWRRMTIGRCADE